MSKSAVSFGGEVVVKNGGEIKGDAVSLGGDIIVRYNGRIRKDAVTLGGQARIDHGGEVYGDRVDIISKIHNKLAYLPGHAYARIDHPFKHLSEKIPRIFLLGPFTGIFGIFGFLVMSAFLLLKLAVKLGIAALVTYLFPRHVHLMADCIRLEFWKTLLIGVIGIIAIPIVFVFLLISILGIPLIPLLYIAYLFGSVGVALCVGRILPIAEGRSDMRNTLLGVLVIGLVRFFPLLGIIVGMTACILSFGVVILTRFGTHPCTRT